LFGCFKRIDYLFYYLKFKFVKIKFKNTFKFNEYRGGTKSPAVQAQSLQQFHSNRHCWQPKSSFYIQTFNFKGFFKVNAHRKIPEEGSNQSWKSSGLEQEKTWQSLI